MKITVAIATLTVTVLLPYVQPGASGGAAQSAAPTALESVVNRLTFRNIGPFRPGAWITAIAVPDTPARIEIHPRNPDVVLVAAMGHLFSRKDERGDAAGNDAAADERQRDVGEPLAVGNRDRRIRGGRAGRCGPYCATRYAGFVRPDTELTKSSDRFTISA